MESSGIKCLRCSETLVNKRKGTKFCSSVCKSSYWVEEKRYKGKVKKKGELIMEASKVDPSLLDLFCTIYGRK